MEFDSNEWIDSLSKVAALSGVDLRANQLRTEFLPAPHRRPSSLPSGTQAVYTFILGESCLKVGKAGPKTQARFTSQHYGNHAPSTLAQSIIKDKTRMINLVPPNGKDAFGALDIESIGKWLENYTARFHIFLPASAPACALALAEAFAQCRLRPIYEGKGS